MQSGVRSSQDREVDPIESQRLQAWTDAAAQDVVRQQRRYNPLARKDPPLIVPLWQSRDPGYKPLENLCPHANLADLIRLGWVNVALVPRPLNSDRSLLKKVAVFQSINLRFSQSAEGHKAARQPLSFIESGPRSQVLRQCHA